VNEVARMDFANGIRSIMRQDPDIILVGEVRDKETAEMAFRAAMTGHQVFTTLHTNSALGVFPRLLDIGIQPDIMAGNIIGVIAQRLVRTLCDACKEAYEPVREERMLLGDFADEAPVLYRPVGCRQCDNKGYKGRSPIMELLVMDADMDELVARRSTAKELRTAAMAKGFRPLAEAGLTRVLDGVTTLSEVSRTVDLTSRHA
jgi:type II secretory ATPase GspE/PulE/Tfp pilus assembly ATPase PilB-like protein